MFETFKAAPLSSGFMLTSIVGLIFTVLFYDKLVAMFGEQAGATWGFTLTLFFIILFIASMISMTYGPEPKEKIN